MTNRSTARRLWHGIEAVNAVTYFSPEPLEASTTLGLEGFWMGYFACRAAPLGAVGPGVVEATFYNFHPRRVRRAIPDAWDRTTPAAVLDARSAAAASALRRLLPDGAAERLATAVSDTLRRAIDAATPEGRPLFAANRDIETPDDPVAALWQRATTLREHRGDGHVALLAGAGLDGCEVHVLALAVDETALDNTATDATTLYQQSRGWSTDDWAAAVDRLATRGLVDGTGRATATGRETRDEIERRTDTLAERPLQEIDEADVTDAIAAMAQAAPRIATDLRFPNPMGLPAPDASA